MLTWDGAVVARQCHKLKVVGLTPTPATINGDCFWPRLAKAFGSTNDN